MNVLNCGYSLLCLSAAESVYLCIFLILPINYVLVAEEEKQMHI